VTQGYSAYHAELEVEEQSAENICTSLWDGQVFVAKLAAAGE
jgi:hypothetical protein